MLEEDEKPFEGDKCPYAVYNVLTNLTPEQAAWLKGIGHRVEDVVMVVARGGKVLRGKKSPNV